jgi:hydrogenase-4 component B
MTGALALACFTKLHGTVFLGTARDSSAAALPGSDAGLVAPQMALAAACVAIGVLPALVVPVATGAAGMVVGGTVNDEAILAAAAPASTISLLVLWLIGLILAIRLFRRSAGREIPARVTETWGCAYPGVTSRMQYPASSFAASLLAAFGRLSGSRVEAGPGTLQVRAADPVLDWVGRPLWERVRRVAASLRVIQTGRLRWYLLYLIAVLLGLLLYLWMAR